MGQLENHFIFKVLGREEIPGICRMNPESGEILIRLTIVSLVYLSRAVVRRLRTLTQSVCSAAWAAEVTHTRQTESIWMHLS